MHERTTVEIARAEFLNAYDRLADGIVKSHGFDGALVRKVKVDAIRDELKERGFLPRDDKGNNSTAGRGAFFKAKAHWINAGGIMAEDKGLIWRK